MSTDALLSFDQSSEHVARLTDVSLTYGKVKALDQISLSIPARSMVGLIGPDGVGKSSILSVIAGARAFNSGQVIVLDGDICSSALCLSTYRLYAPRVGEKPLFIPLG